MISKVFFDITNLCNGKCVYCFTNSNSSKEELTLSNLFTLLEKLKIEGIKNISVGGGEPFISKNIFEFLKKANKLGFIVSITTNGSLLNKSNMSLLKKYKVKMTLSLDSINDETHSQLRKNLPLNEILINLENISSIPELLDNLSIRMTVTKLNIGQIDDIIELCKKIGVKKLKINSINSFGRGKMCKELIPKFEDFRRLILELKNNLSLNSEIDLELPISKYLTLERECTLGKKSLYIDQRGDIYPCAFSENKLKLGNILSNDTLLNDLAFQFNHDNKICKNCLINRYKRSPSNIF